MTLQLAKYISVNLRIIRRLQRMKGTVHLSNFQKQQYTHYLESQLEKFSAFMLSQKKDNQRNKSLQTVIEKLEDNIRQLNDRIKMLEFYQKQNFKQCDRITNDNYKAADLQSRLRKVESLYFERPLVSESSQRSKQNNAHISNLHHSQQEIQVLTEYIDKSHKQFNKKIRNLEKNVQNIQQSMETRQYQKHRESQPVLTNYSQVSQSHSNYGNINNQMITKNELKATEKKMNEIFEIKFSKLQKIIKKSLSQSSKSFRKSVPEVGSQIQEKVEEQEGSMIKNHRLLKDKVYDDYEYSEVKNSFNQKSYCISDTSQRLKPIMSPEHNSGLEGEKKRKKTRADKKQKEKRKRNDNISSKSKSKSKSLSNSKRGLISKQKNEGRKVKERVSRHTTSHPHNYPHTPLTLIDDLPRQQRSRSHKNSVSIQKSLSKSKKTIKGSRVSEVKSPKNVMQKKNKQLKHEEIKKQYLNQDKLKRN